VRVARRSWIAAAAGLPAAAVLLWALDRPARPALVEIAAAAVVACGAWLLLRSPAVPASSAAPTLRDDVVLPERTRREVAALLEVLRSARRARAIGVDLPAGAILHGPPGCGKTLIARAVAAESRRALVALNTGSLASGYAGVGAARVREAFAEARRSAPSVVLIDELDGIAPSRRHVDAHGGEAAHDAVRVVTALLAEIDVGAAAGVFVIGATNHLDAVDPAVRSRLSLVVRVREPDLATRAEILRRAWPRRSRGVDPLAVALWTEGDRLSGRDCRDVLRTAGLIALGRGADAVEAEDVREALRRLREARREVASAHVVGEV
jgi:ATP-dependent 26S proteasome regulatory subunit